MFLFGNRVVHFKLVNLGGGLGVDYHEHVKHPIFNVETYFAIFEQFLDLRPGQEVHFELGRALVAQCGSLITRALYIKKGIHTNFAVVDAGMTELIRPALYHAYQKLENLSGEARTSGEEVRRDDEISKNELGGTV